MFVMVFVVENIRITVMVSIVFFRRVDFNSIYFILKLLHFRVNSCSFLQRTMHCHFNSARAAQQTIAQCTVNGVCVKQV